MMYAVIQTGGKQYRVQEGDILRVAKLSAEAGKKVNFDKVLLVGEGEAVKAGAEAAKTNVSAEVISHGRSPKIEIFKKRRRKHSQRTMGHRQDYTAVRITGIGAAKAAPAKEPVKAAAEKQVEAKKATAKPAVAKKKAAPKATAKTAASKAEAKPAAKKPAARKAVAKSKDKE